MTRPRARPYLKDYLIFHEDGTTSLKPDAPEEIVKSYNKIQSHDDKK